MQNFITLGQPLPGEKYVAEKKEKKKNSTKCSGHFVPQQRPRAAHLLRSDQNDERSERTRRIQNKAKKLKKINLFYIPC